MSLADLLLIGLIILVANIDTLLEDIDSGVVSAAVYAGGIVLIAAGR